MELDNYLRKVLTVLTISFAVIALSLATIAGSQLIGITHNIRVLGDVDLDGYVDVDVDGDVSTHLSGFVKHGNLNVKVW
tara:strand:- start:163 stop:399 length:237 start_codon:yes stop_codon:yes gene_type:complete